MWQWEIPAGFDLYQMEVSQENEKLIPYKFSACKHTEEK